jgi:RNA polymerase sigma-70 factor (ECF subfamily)
MKRSKRKYQKLSDNDLASSFKEGNSTELLTEIYLRFGHLMMGLCLKYLKNKEEAEDTVMELFEGLPLKLEKHTVEHFKSWLYMTTKNVCLMRLRKKNIPSQEIDERIHSAPEEVNLKILEEKKYNTLEDAIEDLNDEQRTAVELFYFKKFSYVEIGERMDLPVKKVKSAIQNGKRNLKLKLEKNDNFKSA